MPRLSDKSLVMPASPIRKLVPYAEAAKKRGVNVYHLNIGQPDIESPKPALDAIRGIDQSVIEYTHSAGIDSYRESLTEYYKSVDINVNKDEIIVTCGGSEALVFAMLSVLNKGDEVLVPEPFYANYNGFAVQAGVNIVPIPSSIDNDFALPDVSEFENRITLRTKAILICNPNNPTGYLYGKAELRRLARIIKKYDLFLISDEVYREFCYDNTKHFSCMNIRGIEDHVIMVDSVSKRYSMCGARLGALVSHNKEVIDMSLRLAQARLCAPYFAQVAAEAAIKYTPKSYFSDVYSEYLHRRDVLVDGLNSIPGVYCPKPHGAFYVILELPVIDSEHFAQWLLEEFSHNGSTVMLAPASGFYASRGVGKNQVRVAYVLKEEDLKASIECLREALAIYPHRTI